MKSKKEKLRAQVKSRFYYIFWGTCTVAVVAGQFLVGSGFRRMAESLDNVLESPIIIDLGIPRTGRPHLMPVPDVWEEEGMWHPTDPPQRVW